MATGPNDLTGLRVLVVEDNLLLAEATVDTLELHGCEVIGPAPTLAAGLALARQAELDCALLDINLRGELCFPIAAELHRRGVPFLFVTGYDNRHSIPSMFVAVRRLRKPVEVAELLRAMTACIADASGKR